MNAKWGWLLSMLSTQSTPSGIFWWLFGSASSMVGFFNILDEGKYKLHRAARRRLQLGVLLFSTQMLVLGKLILVAIFSNIFLFF